MQSEDYLDRHYIGIRKQSETERVCCYEFICTEYRRIGTKRLEQLGYVTGAFQIDKQTGTTELVHPMPGDESLSVASLLHNIPNANARTIISPGPAVVEQASRKGRGT